MRPCFVFEETVDELTLSSLLKAHGNLLDPVVLKTLQDSCKRYGADI
jgi:hypothetical protein